MWKNTEVSHAQTTLHKRTHLRSHSISFCTPFTCLISPHPFFIYSIFGLVSLVLIQSKMKDGKKEEEAVRKQHRCTENNEKCGRKQEKAANEGFTICTEMEPFSLELRSVHERSFSSCNAESSWSHFLCLAL